ncbi:MAG: hypothetical protein A3J46_06785 [Candidatus Yanofskybacteria bacterium RIFCSPHIGHO2_02_FULL_41_11]|uniref:Uncharacterized protein n=1 Tax=Candidatus Yanofskybacteria bacterium RIFCSPHIGHO2_02_FULL_41_11 TaxID=1802675 RepID=A0A1F8F5J1_9BACT|nr:MAG: hypothetical protein A3J46_06785 [Candidatus Yanofskybacteria bacterium RIFCSPHIGHO2_02_FULL_41_11]
MRVYEPILIKNYLILSGDNFITSSTKKACSKYKQGPIQFLIFSVYLNFSFEFLLEASGFLHRSYS